MYGLDSFVAPPPLAALVSLLLLAGCDGIGVGVLRLFGLCSSDAPQWHRWQGGVVGAMTLAIVLYPLALANLTALTFMRVIACVVAGIGLLNAVALIVRGAPHWRGALTQAFTFATFGVWRVLLTLLLVGAALMAMGPVTDADSLDYHVGVPMALLNGGGMPVIPEWFHSRIAGSIEVLNAVGLAVGSESFGALLQLAGLAGIVGLLLFAESKDEGRPVELTARVRTIVAVAALCPPVLIALISQKPQLLPLAMTSLGLALVVYPSRRELPRRASLQNYGLVCLLVMSASQAKLSYMLGGGVVGLLSLVVMARRHLLWPALGLGLLAALVILAPPVMWKDHLFHAGYINSLLRPVPGDWPGTDAFEAHLRGLNARTRLWLPLSLFVPYRLGRVSTVIGPAAALLLLALRPGRDRWCWAVSGAAVFVAAAFVVLAPFSSRYYLEPYFWLLMVTALQADRTPLVRARWITWPVGLQAMFTAALFWYGAVSLFPGALTPKWRSMVMDRSANGYRVMKWADSVLPADAVLLSTHRSIALAPRDAVSLDWSSVVKIGSPEAEPYLSRLKDRGVTHMLAMGSPPGLAGLSGCVGPLVAGPGDDIVAERNPFSRGTRYQAWIFRFNAELLPGCAEGVH